MRSGTKRFYGYCCIFCCLSAALLVKGELPAREFQLLLENAIGLLPVYLNA